PFVKQELGSATIHYLKSVIEGDQTIAVTGGTTMAAVADVMQPFNGHHCMLFLQEAGLEKEWKIRRTPLQLRWLKPKKEIIECYMYLTHLVKHFIKHCYMNQW